ncbi:MAG: hypothetical protein KJ622_12885 [Alphaproteobacteria bacterium]|nr:hypothetical protein [Alphaproteobacteria bacterium]
MNKPEVESNEVPRSSEALLQQSTAAESSVQLERPETIKDEVADSTKSVDVAKDNSATLRATPEEQLASNVTESDRPRDIAGGHATSVSGPNDTPKQVPESSHEDSALTRAEGSSRGESAHAPGKEPRPKPSASDTEKSLPVDDVLRKYAFGERDEKNKEHDSSEDRFFPRFVRRPPRAVTFDNPSWWKPTTSVIKCFSKPGSNISIEHFLSALVEHLDDNRFASVVVPSNDFLKLGAAQGNRVSPQLLLVDFLTKRAEVEKPSVARFSEVDLDVSLLLKGVDRWLAASEEGQVLILPRINVRKRRDLVLSRSALSDHRGVLRKTLKVRRSILLEINEVDEIEDYVDRDELQRQSVFSMPFAELLLRSLTENQIDRSAITHEQLLKLVNRIEDRVNRNPGGYQFAIYQIRKNVEELEHRNDGSLGDAVDRALEVAASDSENRIAKIDGLLARGHEINRTLITLTLLADARNSRVIEQIDAKINEEEGTGVPGPQETARNDQLELIIDAEALSRVIRAAIPNRAVPKLHLQGQWKGAQSGDESELNWRQLFELGADDFRREANIEYRSLVDSGRSAPKPAFSISGELGHAEQILKEFPKRHFSAWMDVLDQMRHLILEPNRDVNFFQPVIRLLIEASRHDPDRLGPEFFTRLFQDLVQLEDIQAARPGWQMRARTLLDILYLEDPDLGSRIIDLLVELPRHNRNFVPHQIALLCVLRWSVRSERLSQESVDLVGRFLSNTVHTTDVAFTMRAIRSVWEAESWPGRLLLAKAALREESQPLSAVEKELSIGLLTWALQHDISWSQGPYPRSHRGSDTYRLGKGTLAECNLAPGREDDAVIADARQHFDAVLRSSISLPEHVWLNADVRHGLVNLPHRLSDVFYSLIRGTTRQPRGVEAHQELLLAELFFQLCNELFGRLHPVWREILFSGENGIPTEVKQIFASGDTTYICKEGTAFARQVWEEVGFDCDPPTAATAEQAANAVYAVLRLFRASVIAEWRFEAYGISVEGLTPEQADRIRSFQAAVRSAASSEHRQKIAEDWHYLAHICELFAQTCTVPGGPEIATAAFRLKAERYRKMADWIAG